MGQIPERRQRLGHRPLRHGRVYQANGLWAGGAIYNNTSDQALPLSLARTKGSMDLDSFWRGFTDDTG